MEVRTDENLMFPNDELARSVWKSKYAQENETHYDQMHRRLAREFARIENKYALGIEKKADKYLSLSDEGQKYYHFSQSTVYDGNSLKKIENRIYNLFKDFKYIIPQGSIMSNLGNKAVTSLSNCFKGDVLVLTRDGWKPIGTLQGKTIEIMTKGGQWVHAPFKNYGEQQLWEVKLSNGYQEKTLFATKDHRWAIFKKSKPNYITEIKTTEQLKESLDNQKVVTLYSTYGKQRNFKLSSIGIAHGITYGDGHTVKGDDNCNNITICGNSRPLGKYFPESYVSSDENNCQGGSDFYSGLPNYFRKLPNIRENKSYLYGWLAGYFAADGHIDENGSVMICSSNIFDIVFIKDVCGVLGIGATEITQQTVISNLTNKEHTMYKCFIHKNHLSEEFFLLEKHKKRFNQTDREPARWRVIEVNETQEIKPVYCAEVPETESFVIEGNILSMNCFVVGQPTDSYGGICKKDEEMAQLMKRRGGVGLDISTLRPATTKVSNAAKSSTGAVSFMHRFSNTTREVAQDGRRGALMLSIDINHPDVMEFIKIKRDLTQVTGANISIKLNNEFMKAVENDEIYTLRFPCDLDLSSFKIEWKGEETLNKLIHINTSNGVNGYIKGIKAKEYWNELIKSAHGVAEPGLMFWDNMIDYSPDGVYEQYKAITTNPCSEIGMQSYDACRLIAVNLFGFVDNPFTPEAKFDFEKFYKINYEAMRLSDDLIDLELEHIDRILRKINEDPEPFEDKRTEFELWEKIKKTAASSRRTGLGFTALGDTLAALGLKYDSDKALEIIERIMSKKMESELDCTIDLAILRGSFIGADANLEFDINSQYDEFDVEHLNIKGKNQFYSFIAQQFPKQTERMIKFNRRNVSFNTVAPTGTVSIMSASTSGIEPLFSPYYFRRKKINPNDEGVRVDFTDQNGDKWQEFPVLHPKFKDWIISIGVCEYKKDIQEGIKVEEMSKKQLQMFFENSPWYNSTANDINWVKRVEIQGIIQKYITHSISSTINLPNSVTEAEVGEIYMESWKKGLKGITVYRDGSRSGVLVSESSKDKQTFEQKDAPKRPNELPCEIHHPTIKNTKYTVIVGLLDSKPYEVFAIPYEVAKGYKNGFLSKTKSGVYNLIASLDEKSTIHTNVTGDMSDTEAALTRLISTSLRHGAEIKFIVEQLNKTHGDLFSFSKVIARVLKKYIPEGAKSTVKCQDCGSENVIFQEGCQTCQSCGSSKCG